MYRLLYILYARTVWRGLTFIKSQILVVGSRWGASGIIPVACILTRVRIPSPNFWFRQRFIAEILGDNKVAEFFAEFSERIHPNLAIFLLMFIKLSLFSLFFSHASTCSPLLTCNTRREGRANVQALSQARAGILGRPWNLSRAGAQRLGPLSACIAS